MPSSHGIPLPAGGPRCSRACRGRHRRRGSISSASFRRFGLDGRLHLGQRLLHPPEGQVSRLDGGVLSRQLGAEPLDLDELLGFLVLETLDRGALVLALVSALLLSSLRIRELLGELLLVGRRGLLLFEELIAKL